MTEYVTGAVAAAQAIARAAIATAVARTA